MKCDLCGEEMLFGSKFIPPASDWYVCMFHLSVKTNENGEPILYRTDNVEYTSDEWQRLLQLKAFL